VLLSPVRRLARPERLPATLDTPLIRQAVEVLMAVSRDEAERPTRRHPAMAGSVSVTYDCPHCNADITLGSDQLERHGRSA